MSKKILIISNALSSLTLLPLTSIACKDKKINEKQKENEKEIKNKLNDYAKNKFNLNIDSSKFTLEEAKNINNYHYTLEQNYLFKLREIKIEKNKALVKYSIFDKTHNIESDEVVKEFTNFKQNITDKFDESKYNELLSLFNLNKSKLASENVNNFTNDKSNENFKNLDVKVLEYDDLLGYIKLSIKGMYKNIPFELKDYTINNFQKENINNSNINNIQGKLDIHKMIEDNKTINDINKLTNVELLEYFSELFGYNEKNEKIDLLNLLKDKRYTLDTFKILSKNNNHSFKIKLSFIYKKFDGSSENIVKKTIVEESNKMLDKISYNDKDIANYLVSKLSKKANKPQYDYASAYRANFWKRNLSSSPDFLELKNEEKYKNQFNLSGIELKDLSVSANDIDGKLHISYQLIMYKKNNDIISSNIYETTISGFKNINLDFLKKNFLINEKDPSNERWKKYAKELKDKYDSLSEQEKPNFEILDETMKAKYFGYSIDNNVWNVMRQRNFKNAEPNELRENNTWNFFYKNIGNMLKEAFNEKTNCINKDEKQFQINNINVAFKKISNFRYENNFFKFDYVFEISYAINNGTNANSESDKIIKLNYSFTQYYK